MSYDKATQSVHRNKETKLNFIYPKEETKEETKEDLILKVYLSRRKIRYNTEQNTEHDTKFYPLAYLVDNSLRSLSHHALDLERIALLYSLNLSYPNLYTDTAKLVEPNSNNVSDWTERSDFGICIQSR